MKIKIITIGKTHRSFLIEGEQEYLKRLKHYGNVEKIELPDIKNAKNKSKEQIKLEEGKLILDKFETGGILVLLDENGTQYSSKKFASWMQNKMNQGGKHITFVVGGAYGFSEEVYQKSRESISLSMMTFNHEMVRMFFLEQLYRAFTILKNEPYHHD